MCCPCAPAAGRGEDGHCEEQGSQGRWTLLGCDGCGVRELLWVRWCVHIPGPADPADSGFSSKISICKPLTWSSPSKGMELLLIKRTANHCPWGEGNSTLPHISVSPYSSVRGLYSPDAPHEDVLQKS